VTKEGFWYSELEDRAAGEAEIIVDAFHRRRIEIGGFRDRADEDHDLHPGGIAFMYAKDHILTREQYLGGMGGIHGAQPIRDASKQRGVLDVLETHGVAQVAVRRLFSDIVLVDVNPQRRKGTRYGDEPGEDRGEPGQGDPGQGGGGAPGGDGGTGDGDGPDVLELLERIDTELGVGVATPDHVLTAAQTLIPCSVTEPQPVNPPAGPYPSICWDGGARVRVLVADTGLVPGAEETFPWLQGVKGDDDNQTGPGGAILPYRGHGTFVAGVLRAMAPNAQVRVENVFDTAGSALESELVRRLDRSFRFGFEILHLTASCLTRKNIPLQALGAWLERLRVYHGVVCVAPAGNNYTRRPAWPGAFPDVLCVGALATDWRHRADFSNHGGWVDVFAPGENLINAFGSGTYTYQFPPDAGSTATFSGLAQWTGTSFSAPIVTGLIAARMARCGESAYEAAAALLAKARDQASPGVGAILLPGCDDDCGCGGCGCSGGCDYGCHCGGRGGGYCGGRGSCGCGGDHGKRRHKRR
jgi:subtilisin family serine protease